MQSPNPDPSPIVVLASDQNFQFSTIRDCLSLLSDFRTSQCQRFGSLQRLPIDQRQFLAQIGLRLSHLALHSRMSSLDRSQILSLNREFRLDLDRSQGFPLTRS